MPTWSIFANSVTYVASMMAISLMGQGCTQNLMWVGSFQEKVDLFDFDMVQMCMLKLGGLGHAPPPPPGKF